MSPQELLARRHRDYKKAEDRHLRALEARAQAEQRVHELERDLADAEDEDRRVLGDALLGRRKPPAGKTEQARTKLDKANAELEALQYAAERAGQTLDHMPAEHKRDWLRQASRDFQTARAEYEQLLVQLAEARERLAQEAELVSFLIDGQASVRMGHTLRVHASGVEGLVNEVAPADVLAALRDELATLEIDVLLGAHR